jgi:hypothetical protein
MQNIEDVLNMLAEYPTLLLQRDYAPHLRFYPVADYMLVCMMINDAELSALIEKVEAAQPLNHRYFHWIKHLRRYLL